MELQSEDFILGQFHLATVLQYKHFVTNVVYVLILISILTYDLQNLLVSHTHG